MTETPADVSATPAPQGNRLKNMGLFLASPFIGLYYAVLLPGKLLQLAMDERKAFSQAGQAKK